MARDENGEIRWHLDLAETAGPIIDVEAMTISLNGHLALVTFDLHFTVLDLLTRQNTAKVLWSEMLFEEGTDISARIRRRRHLAFGPPVEEGEESLGRAALVGEDVVVYQVGGRLTAAEALTGKPLWVREDISPESRLIGGDQHLVLIAPGGMTARILRGLDGETVRRLPLPLPKNQFAFDGEHLLHWTTTNQWRNLECLNLRTGKLRWKIPCPKETLLRHVGTEELALLHSNGQFLVVSKVDGLSKSMGESNPTNYGNPSKCFDWINVIYYSPNRMWPVNRACEPTRFAQSPTPRRSTGRCMRLIGSRGNFFGKPRSKINLSTYSHRSILP